MRINKNREEAEKWLRYAETDLKKGFSRTNAIKKAQILCRSFPDLSENLCDLMLCHVKDGHRHIKSENITPKRVLFPLSQLPITDTPSVYDGRNVVFERFGTAFRISEKDIQVFPHLQGYEGQRGCYCYFREI